MKANCRHSSILCGVKVVSHLEIPPQNHLHLLPEPDLASGIHVCGNIWQLLKLSLVCYYKGGKITKVPFGTL